MKFTIQQYSRQGARPYNQDRLAYSYSKDSLLAVVADGMGGHRHGEIAAQLAVKTLTDSFERLAKPALKDPVKFLNEHIMQVHDAIDSFTLASDLLDSPRTTLVAAILHNKRLCCAHVGDSRLYHFRDGRLIFRTEDHSLVQMLYNKGQISQQQMLTHPERNKIYNCLGGEKTPHIDIIERPLKDGDMLLLCSDGLWSGLADDEIAQLLHAGPISESLPNIMDIAESIADGHSDNLSGIALQWGEHPASGLAVSTQTMPLDSTNTIMNPVSTQRDPDATLPPSDLTDEDIERAIAEIQIAIRKTQR